MSLDPDLIERAAALVRDAAGVMVGAGAGMGVDSGLPDFRGDEGFWKAYPPFRKRGLSFVDMANPRWFDTDPATAWGFYGHRLNLYRETEPHDGFAILRRWADAAPAGGFVFTSNVDGQFQRAGFADDAVLECHGSIGHLQCSRPCSSEIWDAGDAEVAVDEETFQAREPLPECPDCGRVARPNILMFGDGRWIHRRSNEQESRMMSWVEAVGVRPVVVIECGAGTAIPTVRWHCESMAARELASLVRINPREPQAPRGAVSIASGALDALRAIDEALGGG